MYIDLNVYNVHTLIFVTITASNFNSTILTKVNLFCENLQNKNKRFSTCVSIFYRKCLGYKSHLAKFAVQQIREDVNMQITKQTATKHS